MKKNLHLPTPGSPKITHENIIYIFGLIVIFIGAIWIRAALLPIPFFSKDSWEYLEPAMSQLATGTIQPTFRGFFYPAILWCILKLWPNFIAIAVIQHAAGLLAGVLLVITWARMRIFLPTAPWTWYAYYLSGWMMLTVYTFSQASLVYEHSLRPEAIFPLITILCILISTEFSRRVIMQPSYAISFTGNILAFLLVVLAFAAYYLKPAWGLAACATMAPLVVAPGLTTHWVRRALPVILGFSVVFCIFEIPERLMHRTVSGNSLFLAQTIFSANGESIYKVLKKDLSPSPSNSQRSVANLLLPYFDQAIQQHPRPVPFGYSKLNPDDIMYGGATEALSTFYHGNSHRTAAACLEYYWRAWLYDPLGMLRKITTQLFYFYCPWKSVTYAQGIDFQISDRLRISLELLQNHPYSWSPYQEYQNQILAWLVRSPRLSIPEFIVALSTILNPLYMPIVLLAAIGALWVIFSKNPLFLDLRISAFWCLYLLSYNFAMSLTIAVIHMMTVDRYHFSQTIFSVLSQCFSAIFLACLVYRMLHIRFSKQTLFS